jgi:hypothetical protein
MLGMASKMTSQEQRIAIAEFCGWKNLYFHHYSEQSSDPFAKDDDCWGTSPTGDISNPPDYLNDLNAMHEAESTLPLDVYYEYTKELYIVCEGRSGGRGYTFATATQRAEAFLKTIQK